MNPQKSMAVLFVFAVLCCGLGPIYAAPVQAIHPRALLSQVEIAAYRRAMKEAPTPEAKQQLRETTYARLRQRAAAQGMVMIESNPWIPGMRWNESTHEPEPVIKTEGPSVILHKRSLLPHEGAHKMPRGH
jgi:hypothetical protein